ncbi:acyltransferase family protein [Frigoriglobus tundricola]|nr:acyltransferase family protein [Frigoriglobus tundricola]
MLLGVVYHTILFRMFVAPMPPGPPGPGGPPGASGPAVWLQDWLHSFRMPLFFLISGFFSAMMFEKYGAGKYMGRRWTRIGVPLVVGLFTFGPLYILTRDAVTSGPGGGPVGVPFGPPPVGGSGVPGPPPGFGLGAPGGMPFGPPPGGSVDGPGGVPFGPPPGGGPRGPFGAGGGVSERIFGASDRYFHLNHLWFLWYLLVFITLAPPVGWCFDRIGRGPLGRWLRGPLLFPVVLGTVGIPALVAAAGPFGRGLGLVPAIFRGFPDFLWHFDADMAFYAIDFLAGWWLFQGRAALAALARWGFFNLALGIATFAAYVSFGPGLGFPGPGSAPQPDPNRLMWLALYSLSSAFTAVGFIGVFQRCLDRPTRTGRYLADTALWVYLIHQPLVIVGLAVVGPLQLPWWVQTAGVATGAVVGGLLLFEAVVRPTPLMRLFGPTIRGQTGDVASEVGCEANRGGSDPPTAPNSDSLRSVAQAVAAHGTSAGTSSGD